MLASRVQIRRGRRTLKIGHVCPHIRIQCIYHHLPISWAGDLHPSIDQPRGGLRPNPSLILPDMLGLWKEVGEAALVELSLPDDPTLEKVLASGIERPVEEGEEGNGILAQDVLGRVGDGPGDGNPLDA